MRYRNPDNSLRALARQAQTDFSVFPQYIKALHRIGEHPYWITVRELMPQKDTVFYDIPRSAGFSLEPRNNDHSKKPDEPEWENRPPSQDRSYIFKINIPIVDQNLAEYLKSLLIRTYIRQGELKNQIFSAYLGEMTCFTETSLSGSYYKGCVQSYPNLNVWDAFQASTTTAAEPEILTKTKTDKILFTNLLTPGNKRAILNLNLPITWDPSQPVHPDEAIRLNSHRQDPYNNHYNRYQEGDPIIPEITHPFLIENLLASHFIDWLGKTPALLGQKLRDDFWPLGHQLPTQYLNKQINLHYWLEYDSIRSIDADYYPARTAYDVAYRVNWDGDTSTRFHRWNSHPGWAEGAHENGLSSCIVVNNTESEAAQRAGREEARQLAWNALQKRIQGLIESAQKYGYQVFVIEGKPDYT